MFWSRYGCGPSQAPILQQDHSVPRALYRSAAASLALASTVGGGRFLVWSRVLMSHRFVEEASTILDHSSVKMTEVYAERDRERAV